MHRQFLVPPVFVEDVVLYTFRNNLNKWKIILWPVVISIAASSLTMIRRSAQVATVVTVNGESVSHRQFTSRVRELQEQINIRRNEARSRGIPAEFYLQLYGLTDPTQATLDAFIYELSIAAAIDPLWLSLHPEVVSKEILKDLPTSFLDASGNVNLEVYRRYMQAINMRIADYEDRKEEEMQRSLFNNFVKDAGYFSVKQQRHAVEEQLVKKSFDVAKIEFGQIKKAVAKEEIGNAEKESFYETHKEQYRVDESRTFEYWVVSPSATERKVVVSSEAISSFYEKNKNTLYRVAPRVKVRHILIDGATENARAVADNLHQQITKNPELFEKLAQEHSADKDTARVGGVRDFFSRGTYDKSFEQAAFRLKAAGDLAPVTKVDAGFELVQLVERIPATEKSFEDVKGEIEKTVRTKTASDWTRAHLEKIKKDAGNSKEAIKEITDAAETHKDMKNVVEAKANSHTLDGLIVKNGFTLHAVDSYSFFKHDDSYVLVKMTAKEGSYIKPYKDVADAVESDLLESKAMVHIQEVAQAIAAGVRAGKKLADLAEEYDVSFSSTGLVNSTDNSGVFKTVSGLLKKSFALINPMQVVLHFAGNDAYLVALHDTDQESLRDVEFALARSGSLETKNDEESTGLSQAFVSSLVRNARVDFDQKTLAPDHSEESIPYDI